MKENITIGEKYGPAMKIETQEEADAYFKACVLHTMSFGSTRQEAEEIEKANLGYYAGYYDHETADRVMRLFRCAHPIFGTSHPSPEEAFEKGKELGADIS